MSSSQLFCGKIYIFLYISAALVTSSFVVHLSFFLFFFSIHSLFSRFLFVFHRPCFVSIRSLFSHFLFLFHLSYFCFYPFFFITRSCATLRAADLDWIVGPEYSLGGYIFGDSVTNAGSQLTWKGGRVGINKNVTHAGSKLTSGQE